MNIPKEQMIIIRMVRYMTIRVNPVLGWKKLTPFKKWCLNILKWAIEKEENANALIQFALLNHGSLTSEWLFNPHWLEYQEFKELWKKLSPGQKVPAYEYPDEQVPIGTGRQWSKDRGGWVWNLIREISSCILLVEIEPFEIEDIRSMQAALLSTSDKPRPEIVYLAPKELVKLVIEEFERQNKSFHIGLVDSHKDLKKSI
jgi:hypothetical protein